jgi:uncharacterized protein YcbX
MRTHAAQTRIMIELSRILVYPVKSLDQHALDQASFTRLGALEYDRRFAMTDQEGRWINGKRNRRVHRLRTRFDLASDTITVWEEGDDNQFAFRMHDQRAELEQWLSEFFALRVILRQDEHQGFPDDVESPGPTVISTATLEEVAGWFPGVTLDEVRRRYRANLEIAGVEPFWEDRLFGDVGSAVRFRIGEAVLEGRNPCQRCVVPSRDSRTGEPLAGFQKRFAERRAATLPAWASKNRFDHFYRLSVNTRVPADSTRQVIRVGDPVRIDSTA